MAALAILGVVSTSDGVFWSRGEMMFQRNSDDFRRRNRMADRPNYFRPLLELLEDRKMLVASTMLSHNWMDIDPTFNGTDLNSNDKVKDSVTNVVLNYGVTAFGDVTNAVDPANPTHHYLAGKETIHDAVAGTISGGTLQISDGTYAGSDILLDRPITVFGDGANTVIVPEVASDQSEASNFGRAGAGSAGAHQGIIINAHNVTVSNLTLDGDLGPVSGPGSMNYQQGVTCLYDLTQDGNNYYSAYDYSNPGTPIHVPLTVDNLADGPVTGGSGHENVNWTVTNLTVNNTFVHGIAMSGYYDLTRTLAGITISNNSVNNVAAPADRATDLNRDGILVMNSDQGLISGNTVTGVGVGVMTTYYGSAPQFGSRSAPSNHSAVKSNTVTNAVQRAYSVTLNDGNDSSSGYFEKNTATFSDPNNTAVGVYCDHSETYITDDTITGAQTGILVTNTTFDLNGTTGRPVAPLIYGATLITGPTGSHPNAVGIDLRSGGGQNAAMIGEATITGYATGVAISQSPIVPAKTFTDLVIDGANSKLISSALNPFSASDVGTILNVTGGAGFLLQSVRITAVAPITHQATIASVDQGSGGPTDGNGMNGSTVAGFAGAGTIGSTGGAGSISHASQLALDGAHIDASNTVGILAGDNSQVLGGGAFVTGPIQTTGTAVINPTWTAGQVLGTNTLSIGDQRISTTIVPTTAEVINSGNLTLSSTGTFTPLLTGQTGTSQLFDFNSVLLDAADNPVSGGVYPPQAADFPIPIRPATTGPPYETDTWGGTYTYPSLLNDVVQSGTGQLVIAGNATDGDGTNYAFDFMGHKDPNNVGYDGLGNAPLRILDPVDLSGRTAIQVVVKPLSDNLSPLFVLGIIDERGNANVWTFNAPASTATFTTLTLNLLSPSNYSIGPDHSVDLQHIAGFLVGGDNGRLTDATDTPFRFSFDNIAATSVANSQIAVHSTITLGGTLAPELAPGFTPAVGVPYTIIQNTTNFNITTAFSNAPNYINDQNFILIQGLPYQVSYHGGTGGHDVTITRVAEAPPVIHPSGTTPFTYTHTWSGAGAVSVVDPGPGVSGATVTDADDTNLTSMTVSVSSPQAHDVLSATGQGNVTVTVAGGGSILTLTPTTGGLATLGDFQATLRTATYNNTQAGEATGTKTITITAVDPQSASGTTTTTIDNATPSTVDSRFVFYSGSAWDKTGTSPKPFTPLPFSDDNAIATDKNAYIAGSGQATFGNVISYDKGINGIMVDLAGGGNHTGISVATITSDFTFKVGNNNAPNTWAAVASPSTVTVRTGAGTSGSDRIELIWPSGTIKEEWLEVIVKATTNTGLAANDVFFFGSAVANSGNGDTVNLSETNSVDELGARNNGKTLLNNIPITNVFDYTRDGLVNSVDSLLSRNNAQTLGATRYINIGAGGPFAPLPSGDGTAPADGVVVSSALVSSSASPSQSPPAIPSWIVNRLSHVDLNSGPVAKYLEHLADEGTAKAKAILVKADQVADALDLDDELLDGLLVRLGPE
jgi:hypothetical protein